MNRWTEKREDRFQPWDMADGNAISSQERTGYSPSKSRGPFRYRPTVVRRLGARSSPQILTAAGLLLGSRKHAGSIGRSGSLRTPRQRPIRKERPVQRPLLMENRPLAPALWLVLCVSIWAFGFAVCVLIIQNLYFR